MVNILPWFNAKPIRFVVVGVWSQLGATAALAAGLSHAVVSGMLPATSLLLMLGLALFWLADSAKTHGMHVIRQRRLLRHRFLVDARYAAEFGLVPTE